jgi:hypothetical protein
MPAIVAGTQKDARVASWHRDLGRLGTRKSEVFPMQPQRKTNWLPISLIALAVAIVFAGVMLAQSTAAAHCQQLSAQYTATLSGQVYNQVDMAKAHVAYAHACDPGSAADADQQLAHWRAVYPNQG